MQRVHVLLDTFVAKRGKLFSTVGSTATFSLRRESLGVFGFGKFIPAVCPASGPGSINRFRREEAADLL